MYIALCWKILPSSSVYIFQEYTSQEKSKGSLDKTPNPFVVEDLKESRDPLLERSSGGKSMAWRQTWDWVPARPLTCSVTFSKLSDTPFAFVPSLLFPLI